MQTEHQQAVSQDQGTHGQEIIQDQEPQGIQPNGPEKIFVNNVKLYLSMFEEITQKTKEVAILRKQRQELKDYIMHFMKINNIDQCVSETGKLYIAKTKSSQPVNKDYIFSTLSSDLGVEMAERLVESLWSKREVVTKETLRRSKK